MIKYPLYLIAAGAVLSLGSAPPALAGGCCVAPIVVPPSASYVVNQGPVFSGPGPLVSQIPDRAPKPYPGAYPYVGFVYSGYPYGYYNAWVGAPEPAPLYRVARPYWKRPAAVRHRYWAK